MNEQEKGSDEDRPTSSGNCRLFGRQLLHSVAHHRRSRVRDIIRILKDNKSIRLPTGGILVVYFVQAGIYEVGSIVVVYIYAELLYIGSSIVAMQKTKVRRTICLSRVQLVARHLPYLSSKHSRKQRLR